MSVDRYFMNDPSDHLWKDCEGDLVKFEETREKMRNAKSDETKQKLSKLYKGKPRSQEIIDKIKKTKQKNKELRELNDKPNI